MYCTSSRAADHIAISKYSCCVTFRLAILIEEVSCTINKNMVQPQGNTSHFDSP
jgi:hypothetical protein